MNKKIFALSALIPVFTSFAQALPEVWNEQMTNEWSKLDVSVRSTMDGTMQPASFYFPPKAKAAGGKVPLLVTLHSWSYGYGKKDPASWAATECARRGWAMLYPHFRGPNKTPEGCGSDLAVQDIVDQVKWAIANHPVDPDRVYILGGSGGGHMAMLMVARHPGLFAGAYSACGISDLARYHRDCMGRLYPAYAKMMDKACGGTPDENPGEYARRSPLTYLSRTRSGAVPFSIVAGIHDGHRRKGGGTVPVGQSIRAYNALAAGSDRIGEDIIEEIERTEKVPPALAFKGRDPYFTKGDGVLMRLVSGNVMLTLFDGGHSGNYVEGAAWLALQRRGNPANWNVPPPGTDASASGKITK